MRPITISAVVACSLALLFGATAASFVPADAKRIISQKGRRFGPSDVYVKINEDLYIQNDDGNLVHDAYVDSPDFSYESGDINPGSAAVIAFPKEGDFMVLCGIHPVMKLAVHVQSNTEPQAR